MPPMLSPPDPHWPQRFERLGTALGSLLGPAALRIHHIGSTAIPGIWAKPIIDVLLEAPSLEAIDQRVQALRVAGWEALGEHGIEGRRYFRLHSREGERAAHLHVFEAGAAAVARHLAFRDLLRARPDLARAYSDLKRQLAEATGQDRKAYARGKAPFIERCQREAPDTTTL